MRVFTQSNVNHTIPDGDIWLPCVTTESVAHTPVVVESTLITHIAAIQHYGYPLTELLPYHITCVGRHTAERLREMGFKKIRCALTAAEVTLVQPTTWLRGEIFHRDFSKEPNVTTVQTYRSVLHQKNIQQLMQWNPEQIYVYSAQVLQQLEQRSWPHTQLYTVPSAPAQKNLWHTVTEFNPNLPQDAAQALKLLTN
jgi:hypothetical protein